MIATIIKNIRTHDDQDTIEVKAHIQINEYKQLNGDLETLKIFSPETIKEKATIIKTGSRANYAKYLLLPVALRRQFQTKEWNYEELKCGKIEHQQKLYIIYEIEQKLY
ncbi:MAG: hypothetical protein GTO02_23065 [Candidatus Dadabacteria bacterium]|nr:hypothetical protein [Candidatus Dadabacteria bacterium]